MAVSPATADTSWFHIASKTDDQDDWILHAMGGISRPSDASPQPEPGIELWRAVAEQGEEISADAFYGDREQEGFAYGPAFRAIRELRRVPGQAAAWLSVPEGLVDADRYGLHPAVLDACLQVLMAAAPDESDDGLYLPAGAERTRLSERQGAG